MNARRKQPAGSASPTGVLDTVTGNLGKITALLGAVAALLAASQGLFDHLFPSTQRPCVEIDAQVFPEAVKYTEWDKTPIRIKGRNTCGKSLGVYVTFVRRQTGKPNFVLGTPYDHPECERGTPEQVPKCWDGKKPVRIDNHGNWEWETRPPPLSLLSDPGPIEEIAVTWEVRDIDEPAGAPLARSLATVKLIDDRSKRPSLAASANLRTD